MKRVVVVGGGIVGTFHAWEALQRGWKVVHLERDTSPRGASVMDSARRAGASTRVGVLTGTHDAARLRDAGATHVIDSVRDLPAVLGLER